MISACYLCISYESKIKEFEFLIYFYYCINCEFEISLLIHFKISLLAKDYDECALDYSLWRQVGLTWNVFWFIVHSIFPLLTSYFAY